MKVSKLFFWRKYWIVRYFIFLILIGVICQIKFFCEFFFSYLLFKIYELVCIGKNNIFEICGLVLLLLE